MIAKKLCGVLLAAAMLLPGAAQADGSPDQAAIATTASKAAPEASRAEQSTGAEATLPTGEDTDDEYNNGVEEVTIADPIEPLNRAMFTFNDKLYFWVLKPAAKGYNYVVPEPARVSVRNFFHNVKAPIRFVNTLLQGKFEGASTELARFGINSTIGLAGFFDVATSHFELPSYDEDFGQTLGFYGMGGMMYIVWPFLGPSTVRDSIGMVGDSAASPAGYFIPVAATLGAKAYETLNKTSLELGTYEDIIAASVEPYVGVRDGFIQLRNKQINK